MRIIHFVSSDKISGLEILSMNMLREMAKEHEVYYSCPDGDGIKRASELGLGTIICDTRNRKDIKRVCREYKPDIVHAHDPAVSFTCALAGVDFISHLHSNCEWLPKFCPNSVALLYVCLCAKKVICVSESVIKEYIFKKILKKKAVVLNNFVDRDAVVTSATSECGEKYDISFVARLIEFKQPLKFVEIIKRASKVLPGVCAVMVGDGELRPDVERAIDDSGLESNIILKGFDINPHKYVNNSKIGVLTSKYEGFGLVAVEAMLLGKPYVAFPVGGLPNIVNDDNGKLCKNDDEMVNEIIKLLTDEDYYRQKSESAVISSHAFTDKSAYVGKIFDIYNETKRGR